MLANIPGGECPDTAQQNDPPQDILAWMNRFQGSGSSRLEHDALFKPYYLLHMPLFSASISLLFFGGVA